MCCPWLLQTELGLIFLLSEAHTQGSVGDIATKKLPSHLFGHKSQKPQRREKNFDNNLYFRKQSVSEDDDNYFHFAGNTRDIIFDICYVANLYK